MVFRISRALLAQIIYQAAKSSHAEICGLLLGAGDEVREIRPAANVALDPASRFEIDPATLIAAHRAARNGGMAVLGHYHSHPNGVIEPSPCDADMALPDGALWLICAPDGRYALWRAGDTGLHGRFTRCALELTQID
tara:strand:- start:23680 stop:24093 length:414 start_codon:yes stop_codon:yes gene_type:complete